ncbi:TRAP transporter large permease [Arthrobacter frigidicola]|nr:TRAP transporter large permease [Arthrobacter frigidicola]
MSITLIAIFFILLAIGVPLSLALGMGVVVTLVVFDVPLSLMAQTMFSSMNSFLLIAVPLFVLAGNVMAGGGISERIFQGASVVFGRFRGGLGQVNIVGSAIFGGISGSSVADVVSLGKIEIKAMTDHGYPKAYGAAMTMVTSTLSSVIPPSILMIIAASSAGVSVGSALAGGFGPSAVFIAVLMVLNYVLSVRKKYGVISRASFKESITSIVVGIPALGGPVVILLGLFGGLFTPTEAAAIAVIYSVMVGMFVYRDMRPRHLPAMFIEAGVTTGTILFIAMVASVASYIFTIDGLPARVSSGLTSLTTDPTAIMLIIGLILLLVGALMDITAAILLTIPVLMPTAVAAGVDPLHFVVFLVAALSIGLVTPPVGVSLFATSFVAKLPMEQIVRAALPHYVVLAVAVLLLAVFPGLVLLPAEWLTGYVPVGR